MATLGGAVAGYIIRSMGRMALKHFTQRSTLSDLLHNMKAFTSLLALATAAHAHYNFPSMVYNGVTTPSWAAVRQWTNYYTYQPVQDVTSLDLRCNKDAFTVSAASTLSVAAGSTLAFTVSQDIYHAGPALVYTVLIGTYRTRPLLPYYPHNDMFKLDLN